MENIEAVKAKKSIKKDVGSTNDWFSWEQI